MYSYSSKSSRVFICVLGFYRLVLIITYKFKVPFIFLKIKVTVLRTHMCTIFIKKLFTVQAKALQLSTRDSVTSRVNHQYL